MELIADTTVLIDLWRFGSKRNRIGDLVAKVGHASLVVPWITQAEFSRGALFKGVELIELESFYGGFLLLPLDRKAMDCYCNLWVAMAGKGKAPDYPDLWIAACAVSRGIPVLTRNARHFAQIPGLEVVTYEVKGRQD
jgi:predicted nucleic acid-binding protein